MISSVPENVTCLACRDYARAERIRGAELAEALTSVLASGPAFAEQAKVTPEQLAAEAREYREFARRFGAAG
jgi:hypothetical protein